MQASIIFQQLEMGLKLTVFFPVYIWFHFIAVSDIFY